MTAAVSTRAFLTVLVCAGLGGAIRAGETARPAPTEGQAQESFDAPSLDLVNTWLLRRLIRQQCGQESGGGCAALKSALALMQKGAWDSAEKTLANLVRESPEMPACAGRPEGWFLEGVLLNCLHRSAEAAQELKRARERLGRAPLVDLELGRAEFEAGDWTAAEKSLSAALADRALRPRAHYLRARIMMSQGFIEAAAREVSELTRCARHRALPREVESFVADVLRRQQEEGTFQPITSVIEQPVPELMQAVMPLRGLHPSAPPPPGGLEKLLKELGAAVDDFFRDFSNTAATEGLWQTRLNKSGKPAATRYEEFYFLFLNRREMGRWWQDEYRSDRQGHPSSPGGLNAGYMATPGFVSTLVVFHPTYQSGVNYRYLGRQRVADELAYVVGFAQRPGHSTPLGLFKTDPSRPAAKLYLQGIAWISADEHQVLRMRTDLLEPAPQVHLNREIAEVEYRPHRFASSTRSFWLPSRVRVNVEWGKKRLLNEHYFSQYGLFKVDTSTVILEPQRPARPPSPSN